jgi:hypothetical protein
MRHFKITYSHSQRVHCHWTFNSLKRIKKSHSNTITPHPRFLLCCLKLGIVDLGTLFATFNQRLAEAKAKGKGLGSRDDETSRISYKTAIPNFINHKSTATSPQVVPLDHPRRPMSPTPLTANISWSLAFSAQMFLAHLSPCSNNLGVKSYVKR